MAFLFRAFSRSREVPPDVDQLRGEFSRNKDELSSTLARNADVRAFAEMIYETSDQETQYFLLSPSYSWLKQKEQLICRVFSGFSSQGLTLFGRLSSVIQEHGVEPVADIVLHVFKLLSGLFVTKHVDNLPESLDYWWQLGSPLSRKPSFSFHHQQWTGRHNLRAGSPFQDHDGENAMERVTDIDKVEEEESIKVPKSIEDAQETTSVQEQEDLTISKPEEEEVSVTGGPEAQVMRLETPKADVSCELYTDNSSTVHSRRMSYGGSELYTTDSDDDSLSTSSHMSLLVAVSEVQESDSSSEDDSVHLVDGAGHALDHHTRADPPSSQGNEEPAEDKLPICHNSPSSENESFYTPEMWTYSDKDTNDFVSNIPGQPAEDTSISLREGEQQKEMVEEVKVVIEANYTDKFVSVSFQPASTFKSLKSLTLHEGSSPDPGESPGAPDAETESSKGMSEEQEVVKLQIGSPGVIDSQEATSSVEAPRPQEDVDDSKTDIDRQEATSSFEAPRPQEDGDEGKTDIDSQEATSSAEAPRPQEDVDDSKTDIDTQEATSSFEAPRPQEDVDDRKTDNVEKGARYAGDDSRGNFRSSTEKSENATTKDVSETEAPVIPHSGFIAVSGPVDQSSYSGPLRSLSLRSDSSTTSARSFAFPILASEWTSSSPVKMAPPDRKYVKHAKHSSWSRSLCCFCSSK